MSGEPDQIAGARPVRPGAVPAAMRTRVAGLDFDRLTEAQVVGHIIDASLRGCGGWVVTPNIDICRIALHDPAQRALVSSASLIVPDGVPLLWAARLAGHPLVERVTGASLIFSLTAAAAQHGRSVYLLGGAPGVAQRAAEQLRRRFPGLAVAGVDSPPVGFDAAPGGIEAVRRRLAEAAPDIVYVGMGFPKQERLITRLLPSFPAAWFVGCGAAIPFAAGAVPRAPRWMQHAGLEWLVRLACEPRRLFRRYVIHDLPFAAWLLTWCALERSARTVRTVRSARAERTVRTEAGEQATAVTRTRASRVLVVGHYASERLGGEGSIPLRLFGRLRAHGVEAWLVTHDSARAELSELLPAAELGRVVFVRGLPGFGAFFTWGQRMPSGLRTIAWGITQIERQVAMLPVIRQLVRDLAIDVVHQPVSVSPVIPSPLARLGAPVVMGPLNGGMELPPAFRNRDSALYALTKAARPVAAKAMNHLIRGRLSADVVLVANDRTGSLLPRPVSQRVTKASDIGVVLASWPVPDAQDAAHRISPSARPARFLFSGRLVPLKGVDLLLDAFARVAEQVPVRLDIVGDGPERALLQSRARSLGHGAKVTFHGWLSPEDCARQVQACDVYVSPSLQESGGVAVLEAMASARPVIATAWGGHLDSVDHTSGILVDVSSPRAMVQGLADAMARLAADPGLRSRLGAAGRSRVEQLYDWDVLIDRTLRIYDEAGTAWRKSAQHHPEQPIATLSRRRGRRSRIDIDP